MGDPVAELRFAVEAAASTLRDGAEAGRLRADPRTAAEARARRLLHQRRDAVGAGAGRAAARVRRRNWRRSSAAASRAAWSGSRSPAPASSTSSSPTPGTGGAAAELASQASGSGGRPAPTSVTERIKVEFVSANPTGPAERRRRPRRRLRRLDRPAAGVGRPRRRARVLHQRRRRPDRPLRGFDRRADDGRAAAGGRLRGRVRQRTWRTSLDQRGHRPGRPRGASGAAGSR